MNNIKLITALSILAIFIQTALSQEKGIELNRDMQNKFDHYYYAALNAKTQNKYAEAFDLLQHCLSIDSTNASVLVELSAFYSSFGQAEKGLSLVNKALKYDAGNYYYNMIAANLNSQIGNNDEVVGIYKSLITKYPAKVDLYLELANAYSDNKEYEQALNALDSLQKYSGDNPAITINKFRLYNMMDKKEEAYSEIQTMIDKNPDNIIYKLLMGDLYLQDNQSEKAIIYYNQVKEVESDNPNLIMSMINYFEKTGDKESSTLEIEKAVSNPKMDIDEKMQLISKYISVLRKNHQDLEKINPLLEKLLNQYPNNSELNLFYGELLIMQDDKEGALEQFEIFKTNNPENPTGYGKILEIIISDNEGLDSEKLTKILELTNEGIKNIPEAPEFYFYNAMAYLQQDKLIEGRNSLEQGLKNAEFQNPIIESDFLGQIGDIYHMQNDDVKAFEFYDKALTVNPHNLHVLNNYSYYLSLEKRDLDRAERMSSITVKAEPTNPTFLDTYAWVLFEQEAYVLSKIYIEKAIEYGEDDTSAEVYEHYGDILFMSGEVEKAVEQWKKAKELGGQSKVLNKKIKKKKYYKK